MFIRYPNTLQLGFSLLELIIALAIAGIIAGIAIPNYQSHLLTSRRADGKTALINLAASLERYHIINHTYEGANFATLGESEYSQEKFYQLQIRNLNTNRYVLAAVPLGPQQADIECTTLMLNHLGEKSSTGQADSAVCWN